MLLKKGEGSSLYELTEKVRGVFINICGNSQVILEGCRGVAEYTDTSIKLSAGRYIIAFSGRDLHIECMTEYNLVIKGFITRIEYIY